MNFLHISKRNRTKLFEPFKTEFGNRNITYKHISLEEYDFDTFDFIYAIAEYKPDVILVHHNKELLDKVFWIRLKIITNAHLAWWINDERFPPDKWRLDYVNIIDHYLVASTESVKILRAQGAKKTDYLLMGIPEYLDLKQKRTIPIVFTGQNSHNLFPNSKYREYIILQLYNHFRNSFKIYGKDWGWIATAEKQSMNIYNITQIGISIEHYNTNGCHSNRLLEIMGRGALAFSSSEKQLTHIFEHEKHLIYFKDHNDLIKKINYYMKHKNKARIIAENGRKYVLNNFTWRAKAIKIIELLNL